MGIFAGLGGASHGPGEMLQGNIAPNELVIEAWPELTALAGEPAMTIIPSFLVSGILTVIVGVMVAVWATKFVQRKTVVWYRFCYLYCYCLLAAVYSRQYLES